MSAAPKVGQLYTYADLLTWPQDEHWELIDGVPYLSGVPYGSPRAMASPNRKHQKISMNLCREFSLFLKNKTWEVYHAPFDVRLFANGQDNDDKTVVQPDLLVVCDHNKLSNDKNVIGAPNLIIEILSPSNTTHDTITKFQKYRDAGVLEIWFVDPQTNKVQIFKLIDKKYSLDFYGNNDIVPVGILPGLELDLRACIQ